MDAPSQPLRRVCRPHRPVSTWVPQRDTPQDVPDLFGIQACRRSDTLVESKLPTTPGVPYFSLGLKNISGNSQEEERRYPLNRYPHLRTQPSVGRCTLDPLLLSAYVRASTSRLILRYPSRSCEGPISCRGGCPRCGRTKLRRIAVRLSAASLRPCLVATQVRGREERARCVRRHLPMKPRTRALSVIAGERTFRYRNAENYLFLETKTHLDHRRRHREPDRRR